MTPPRIAQGTPRRRAGLAPPVAVLCLIVVNVSIELALAGADAGWWGSPAWRSIAYHNGAFWAGLLDNWRPNYRAQPVAMFVTYAFLHAGLGHLAGNMLILWLLGALVAHRAGQRGFLAVYLVSAILGAAAFALLGPGSQPMVGASGALFGLAGAWKAWEFRDLRATGRSTWPVWRDLVVLAVLNLAFWYLLGGVLAWQAHLGGFLGGALAAVVLRTPRVPPIAGR